MKIILKEILKSIKNWIVNDKKAIMLSVLVGLFATITTTVYTKIYAESIQANIAGKVIRFHVLANSNTRVDQSLKLKVRDKILLNYKKMLENCENVDQSRKLINENINGIEEVANKVIKESGFNYIAKASLEKTDFPTKYYGNVSFPPGEYEALRIEIGEAEGENWWCVMFPPLCFVDITQGNTVTNTKPTDKPIAKEITSIPVSVPISKIYTTALKTESTNNTKIENIENTNQTIFKETKEEIKKTEKEYKNDFYNKDQKEKIQNYSYYNNNFYSYDMEKTPTTPISEEKKGNISEKSKEILKNTLDDEEYNLVTNTSEEIVPIKIKFKVVEFWQNMKVNKTTYVKK